jgi:hypothetical protein
MTKLKELIMDKCGNLNTILTLVIMTVALVVAYIIVGTLTSLNLGLNAAATAGLANATAYIYLALQIVSIGTIIYAAWSLLGIIAPGIMGGRRQ